MKAYELLYFVDPALDEAGREAVSTRIKTTIESTDGSIESIDEWGKRKLAYEIDKLTDGDYTLVNFQANPDSIAELNRILRITNAVIRHMVVRREEVENKTAIIESEESE